jgi:predicted permease
VLAGAAGLALAIAFTNLAGLLIVRSIDRRRELAVRTALGARPFEIAKQLLLESSALVAMGTVAGILLAMWLTPAVARLALPEFGAAARPDLTVSWRVIGAVAAVSAACAWLCAAIPASTAARRGSLDLLRRGATSPPRERALRRLFVAVEVALAFVLLVSMTMVGRSLVTVLRVNPGFEPDGVLALKVALPSAAYNGDRVAAFYRTLQGAVEERLGPGTTSVIDELPLTHDQGRSVVRAHAADAGHEAVVRAIAPGYFEVMRIPIRDGRGFDRGDTSAAPPRVVVSESLAARLFPSEQGAGRQVLIGPTGQRVEVVGVVGDVKHRSLDEKTAPTVYVAAAQQPSNSSIMVVRSGRPDADVIAAVREEVMRLDAELPVYGVASMRDVTDRSPGVPARRVLTAAFSGFALVAVVLGTLGLFGVVAHDVASRRAELALRIALGADPHRIVAATLGQGAMVVGTGLAVGGILAIWATRALSGGLPGAIQLDVLSVAAPAIVLAIAGAAAVVPVARRAAHTDPLELLRAD